MRCELVFNKYELHSDKNMVHQECAGVEVFTPFQFQQGQLLLLTKNAFLVLVLGLDVVDIECRNEDCFQIVCTGVVHDFQNRLSQVIQVPVSV